MLRKVFIEPRLRCFRMTKNYGAPFYERLYSAQTIRDSLVIPSDASKIPLPGILERIIGKFYVVSQMDMYRIEGNILGQFAIAAMEGARMAREKAFYADMVTATR